MVVEIQKAVGGQGLEFVGPSLKHGLGLEDGLAPIDGVVSVVEGRSHDFAYMSPEWAIDRDEVRSESGEILD